MFTFLHDKFTQDSIYQILSALVSFVEDMAKNMCVFLVHSIDSKLYNVNSCIGTVRINTGWLHAGMETRLPKIP